MQRCQEGGRCFRGGKPGFSGEWLVCWVLMGECPGIGGAWQGPELEGPNAMLLGLDFLLSELERQSLEPPLGGQGTGHKGMRLSAI